jgi:hypothetical protein
MKTILIFDFETDEDAAQKARHRVEGWKQGFRLGDKLTLRFERGEAADGATDEPGGGESKGREGNVEKSHNARHVAESEAVTAANGVRVAVLLHFSGHEKLSYQRWLERVPGEDPFNGRKLETVSDDDDKFAATAEWFDSLESTVPARRPRK